MNEYLILFVRSVVTYVTLVIFARIMGRKQISQLTYFDYVVGITIGSIASTASVEKNVNNIKDVVFAGIQADEQIYVVTKDD